MNGILPTYLTQHSLWSIHESGFNAYALELFAFLQGKAPARSEGEKKALPEAQFLQAAARSGRSSASTESRAMIIPITGMILPKTDYYWSIPGLDLYQRLLLEAETDSTIAGTVLAINSGGGSVMQLAEFAAFLQTLTKPVVAYTDGYLCSAAYYIAMACKGGIYSTPFSGQIANIGTVFRTLDMIPYLEKMGAVYIEVYGTEAVDKDLGFKEAKEGKTDKLKAQLVTPFQDMFLADVAKYRPAVEKDAKSGAIYTPDKALEMGLIDGVGSLADAVQQVFELAPSSNTTTTNSKVNMKVTMTSLMALFGINTEAKSDEELGLTDAAAIQMKATEMQTLQNQVSDLTTTNATLKKEKDDAEAKVTQLQAQLDAAPGAEPKTPVLGKTEKIETTEGNATAKMDGEDELLAAYGF
ncbi:S49 family peptidase [Siphonobacter sp.]|uniref:S49 family peptidase n=1 Tax=Siphonobacter sp. TaxID=1869184 RepID=UPI003B3B7F56